MVESAVDEISVLHELLLAVDSSTDLTAQDGNPKQLPEEQMLESDSAEKATSSGPYLFIDNNFSDVDNLNCLVAYIFERRFGWSEGDSSAVAASDGHLHRLSVVRRPTLGGNADLSKSLADDLRSKSQINEALDKLITW